MRWALRLSTIVLLSCCVTFSALAAGQGAPVSYYKQVVPIFKRSCNSCHHPAKRKGDLDLTTHASILKGGKHGRIVKLEDPKKSPLVDEISGAEPSMPKDGNPLSKAEVALLERWIAEGAQDDTPADRLHPYRLAGLPKYSVPAVISALTFSPDGQLLAVAGYHEVLLYKADRAELVSRLVGESPKIESIAFSSDGQVLGTAGGAPAVFGQIQLWNVAEARQLGAYNVGLDSVYGISFSPDNTRIAVGGADKSVRILRVMDGTELVRFDNHSDWVFCSTFTRDGKRLLSGSRDRAMKLIAVENGQFIDDINKLLEPILCFAHHPKQELIAYGGELGNARIYKISENQGRTAANNDANLVTEVERQPGSVYAIAYSPDGGSLALGGIGSEVRVYGTNGVRTAALAGHQGAVFAIAWHPGKPQIVTGGYEGRIRVFDPASGKQLDSFIPFPIEKTQQAASK